MIQPKPIAKQIIPLVQRKVEEEEESVQTKPMVNTTTPLIQRQAELEEDEAAEPEREDEKEPVQTKPMTNKPAPVAARLQSRIQSIKDSGRPLPEPLRRTFEPRFGHDFSRVRIHTSAQAAETASALRARAYTMGQDIVFGPRQYAPGTNAGNRLIAHELTHVLQQQNPGSNSSLSGVEAEAEATSVRVVNSSVSLPVRQTYPAHSLPVLFSTQTIKKAIEDEIDDVFVNMNNVWPTIRSEASQNERDNVSNDIILEEKVRRQVSEMELLKTYLLLKYQKEMNFPAHFKEFIDATDRTGTHESRIYAIFRGINSAERGEMQSMPGVRDVLIDEMSGLELKQALRLLGETVTRRGHARHGIKDTEVLEIEERYVLNLMVRGSFSDIAYRVDAAAGRIAPNILLADTSLWAMLADEFAAEKVWYLRMIAKHQGKTRFQKLPGDSEPYIGIIWDSVKELGTKEEPLIDKLKDVNRSAPDKRILVDEPWFMPMLKAELSGSDLSKAKKAISVAGSGKVAMRDDLEDAIDDKDMIRIRKILKNPTLSAVDRKRLANDPVILDEIGEELKGIKLLETSLLLRYGRSPFPGKLPDLLQEFRHRPFNVATTVTFLQGLTGPQQQALLQQPGVYFTLSRWLPSGERVKLMAAIRSKEPEYQVTGSEGTHRKRRVSSAVARRVKLPVSFTASEIRIPIRFNVDTSQLPPKYKFKTGKLEDWIRVIGKVWNNKFALTSGAHKLPLIFAPYMAVGLSTPDKTIKLYNHRGRSGVYPSRGLMKLYLKGISGDGLEPLTVAHEFGHILGYPDDYNLTPADYRRLTGKAIGPIRGGKTARGLMGNQRVSTELAVRHVVVVAHIVNQIRNPAVYPVPFRVTKI